MWRYTRGFVQIRGAAIIASVFPFPKVGVNPVEWIVGAVNTLMKRQPAAQDLLAAHAGRTIHLYFGYFHFALTIGHDGLLSPADLAVIPDVTLRVDLARLMRSGWVPGHELPEMAGLLHVTGDAAMAQTLSTLARHWRPDLEDLLSEFVGDVLAVRLVRGAKSVFQGVFDATGRLAQNLTEYLAYESRELTPVPVMQTWDQKARTYQKSIKNMDQRLDELSRRIQTLESMSLRRHNHLGSSGGEGA